MEVERDNDWIVNKIIVVLIVVVVVTVSVEDSFPKAYDLFRQNFLALIIVPNMGFVLLIREAWQGV